VGFVVVAFLATVARWLLVARLHGWSVSVTARPFVQILPIAAASTVLGAAALGALQSQRWPALVLSTALTLVVYVGLLRLLARHVISDALGVVPAPDRYVIRLGRLFRLNPDSDAGSS
jgi:hypothetical protein